MDTIEAVTDRIVEKNQKFWSLLTDSTLSHEAQLRIVDELFPSTPEQR